jgi:hypothetical protein
LSVTPAAGSLPTITGIIGSGGSATGHISIALTHAGSGYTSAPTVTITGGCAASRLHHECHCTHRRFRCCHRHNHYERGLRLHFAADGYYFGPWPRERGYRNRTDFRRHLLFLRVLDHVAGHQSGGCAEPGAD